MTAREIADLLDKQATLVTATEHLNVPVRILDARENFGRMDVLVAVVWPDGLEQDPQLVEQGGAWVSADRVKVRKR